MFLLTYYLVLNGYLILCIFSDASLCSSVESSFMIKNITVIQGKNVTLRCVIGENDKYIKRTWTQGSSVIFADSQKFLDDSRWTLITNSNNEYVVGLKNSDIKDEEMYTCRTYGNIKEKQIFRLLVNVPPVFLNVSSDLTVDENTDVMLLCEAYGKPTPQVTWRHLIPSDDGVRARSMHLPLGKVKRSSGGKYECIADNDVSLPVKHLIQLTVNYPPEIDKHYSKSIVQCVLDSSVLLECVAIAVPSARFVWILPDFRRIDSFSSDRFYSVVDIETDNSVQSQLLITHASYSDFGNFTCVASNILGTSSFITRLSQKTLPPTRAPPKLMFDQKLSVELSSDGDRGSAVPSYHVRISILLTSLCIFHCVML